MKTKLNFSTAKSGFFMLSMLLTFTACNDDPQPEEGHSVVGKWQKYQILDDEGNFSEGDLDEFWIFGADGSFKNEDGGSITTTGYYIVDGSELMIYSHDIDDPEEEENFSGSYIIDSDYMTYSFIDMKDGDKSTIRFKKM